jgi:hypothetical protein
VLEKLAKDILEKIPSKPIEWPNLQISKNLLGHHCAN